MKRMLKTPHWAFVNFLFACLLAAMAWIFNGAYLPWLAWSANAMFFVYFATSIWRPAVLAEGKFTYIKIDTLFISSCFLIFFLPYLVDALNGDYIDGGRHFPGNFFANYANTALLAALSGCAAFTAGIQHGRSMKLETDVSRLRGWAGFGMLAAGLLGTVILIYVASGLEVYAEGAYTGNVVGEGSAAGGLYMLVGVLTQLNAAVVAHDVAVKRKVRVSTIACALLVLYWMGRNLWFGDRSSFFAISLVFAGGVFGFRYNFRRWQLLLAIIVALVLYSIVGVIRKDDNKSVDTVVAVSTTHEFDIAEEFRGTTVAARASFAIVPEHVDYFWGKSIILTGIGVVPFARGFVTGTLGVADTESSKVLSDYLLGSNAGWGLGSNIISDAYMNFGFAGVVGILFVVGLLGGILENKVRINPGSLKWSSIYLIGLANYAILPRYTMAIFIRPLVWALALFALYALWRRLLVVVGR